jgi:hypothetical protein
MRRSAFMHAPVDESASHGFQPCSATTCLTCISAERRSHQRRIGVAREVPMPGDGRDELLEAVVQISGGFRHDER